MSRVESLRDGTASVGVVGLGYIGFSTAAFFAQAGINVIGFDVDARKVDSFNAGRVYIENIEYWLGFDYATFVDIGRASATHDVADLSKCAAVFVAVPTERDGDPYMDIVKRVVKDLSAVLEPGTLVVVESTMTPGSMDSFVVNGFRSHGREDILVAVAPRRDWFVDGSHTMKSIPRIVGSSTKAGEVFAGGVLELVCDTVILADSHREAELIKSVENAYRHMQITLANQLALSNPDVNMRQVLNIIGTKWNINSYHPNLGVGGYCIAPASKYVLGGVRHPEKVTLLQEAVKFTAEMAGTYADLMEGHGSVAILGLAYKGGLKVDILSPGREMARELSSRGVEVVMHDPMYSNEEIVSIVSAVGGACTPAGFQDAIGSARLVLVACDHREYRVPFSVLSGRLSPGTVVLDVYGLWERNRARLLDEGVKLVVMGEAGWTTALKVS